jgi:integral membrane protein
MAMTISNSFFKSTLGWFRLVALTEGISYLFLLFFAMPLKYFGQIPEPVKYFGWVHGGLFVLYGLLLIKVWVQYRWTFKQAVFAFVASLLPFGTLALDKKLRRNQSLF